MSFLADRLKEKSTWAGIGVLVGFLPLGIYSGAVQQLLGLAQTSVPGIITSAGNQDWAAAALAALNLAGAVLAIVIKTKKGG